MILSTNKKYGNTNLIIITTFLYMQYVSKTNLKNKSLDQNFVKLSKSKLFFGCVCCHLCMLVQSLSLSVISFLTCEAVEYTGANAMPASVEPRRSLPAVVVRRSRRVDPCSREDALLCRDSKASDWSFSSFIFPTTDSLFSVGEKNRLFKPQISFTSHETQN